jgi:hypothetical protein
LSEGDEVSLFVDGDYAVAGHDGSDAGQVVMTVVEVKGGQFEVVLWADHTGSMEAENSRRGVGVVGVEVGCATGDDKGDAAADLVRLATEGPGHGAVDAADGLIVAAMDVRKRDAREWRQGEFEEVEGAKGFMAGLKKGDAYLADADRFVHSLLRFRSDNTSDICEFYC